MCVCDSRCLITADLPADAGDQRLGPDWGDDKERLCCGFGLQILVAGHQVVPFHVVLWVQSVNLVGGLDYFGGHQARLSHATKPIHGISQAAVRVVGTHGVVLVMAAVGGRAAGAVPRHQGRVPVHVVGAFALRGGGAGAGPGRGRARAQAAFLH